MRAGDFVQVTSFTVFRKQNRRYRVIFWVGDKVWNLTGEEGLIISGVSFVFPVCIVHSLNPAGLLTHIKNFDFHFPPPSLAYLLKKLRILIFFNPHLRIRYVYWFLEREGERRRKEEGDRWGWGEREREKGRSISVREKYWSVASCMCPTSDGTRSLFGVRDDAPTNCATQPRLKLSILLVSDFFPLKMLLCHFRSC